MSFRSVFLAVVIAFALIVSAFLINRQRPAVETAQPTADFVRASGKCAECHARLQYSVVHEYEMSAHAKKGINCLDCHQPGPNQQKVDHHGFIDRRSSDRRKLPLLPRRHLSGIPAQPTCRAELGRGPRRKRPESGAGLLQRAVPTGRHEAATEPPRSSGRPSCSNIWLRTMPCSR